MTVRVLLVDEPAPAQEVAALLADEAGLEVVEQATSTTEALVAVARQAADVALVAARLPDGDGLTLCRALRVRVPELRCLLLTSRGDDDTLFDAIMAGASGLAPHRGADLVQALRVVGSGGSLLEQQATVALLDRLRRERERVDPLAHLTTREQAVLDLIGSGFPNRGIATRLGIDDKAVKRHVSHLMGKLGLQRRTQLVEFAAALRGGGPLERKTG